MFLRRPLGSSALAYRVNAALCSRNTWRIFPGFARNFTGGFDLTHVRTNLGRELRTTLPPCSLHLKNYSGTPPPPPPPLDLFPGFAQDKQGMASSGGSVDLIQSLLKDRGNNIASDQSSFRPRQLEANAHVVHIKLMRNNSFVTMTDAKGNRKAGISAGQVAGRGTLLTRYSGGAAAESIGRRVRQMKIKSVVVKVNGHCAFKKKKDSILSFRDGFSDSRNNVNPVVYVEDTTRKPHNGCRHPKQRRTKKKKKKGN